MLKMNKKNLVLLLFLAVLLIGVMLVSGCGGAQEDATPSAEETQQEDITPPPEETQQEDTTPSTEEAQPEPGTAQLVHFDKLIPFLPDPPSGWVAEDPSGMMMSFGGGSWSIADRYYTKGDDDASIAIIDSAYLSVGPWMIWEGYFEYETTEGYLKSTNFKGYPAWEEHTKPDHYALHIGIADRFMVSISVTSMDKDTLYAFANKIDYDGIAALN